MLFSGAWVKMIHEKKQEAKKTRDIVPLKRGSRVRGGESGWWGGERVKCARADLDRFIPTPPLPLPPLPSPPPRDNVPQTICS
jgi:hypothetical protein